jgi:hypothetical protein
VFNINWDDLKIDPITIDATAEITDTHQSGKFDVDSNANMTSSTDGLTDADKTFDSTANWFSQTTDPKWAGTKWNSTANWRWQATDPLWAGTKWNSTANWRYQATDPKWAGTSWNSTANWRYQTTASQWAGTSWNSTANWRWQSTAPQWGGTTWTSTANWRYQSVDPYWGGTTWNSTANFKYSQDNLSWDQVTFDSVARVSHIEIPDWVLSDLQNKIDAKVKYSASGGAYYGGSWHSIPQYAGGTTNAHGSLFVAGEAGPEVVGHIGGRTEVLNQSQLASTMYASIKSAMAGIRFTVSGETQTYDATEDTGENTVQAIITALQTLGLTGDALQNVQAHISSGEVYDSVRESNNRNTRMTGVNAFA